jgi:hypothetical protein
MSYVAIAVGAGTVIMGGVKAIKAGKDKKKLARDAANMKEVPLESIANGLKVSTIGAKNRQEGQSVLEATQTATLADAGTRAILGGTANVANGSKAVNRDIAANLDEQQKQIDGIAAEDNARIRGVKEDRNTAKLAALSSQYNAAANSQEQGFGNIVQGAGMAGTAAGGISGTSKATPIATAAATRGAANRQFSKGASVKIGKKD